MLIVVIFSANIRAFGEFARSDTDQFIAKSKASFFDEERLNLLN